MLSKLKVEFAHNTIQKLSQMFTDLTLSKDLMEGFRNYTKDAKVIGIEIKAEVLTSGTWPER